jgi:hypothetical protein
MSVGREGFLDRHRVRFIPFKKEIFGHDNPEVDPLLEQRFGDILHSDI